MRNKCCFQVMLFTSIANLRKEKNEFAKKCFKDCKHVFTVFDIGLLKHAKRN